MEFKYVFGLCLVLAIGSVRAQTPVDAPEWIEEKEPPPPSYSKDRLIPIDMPSYVTQRVGVDPDTITVGADGVVRYVVVMRNTSGSVSAAYEGILCSNGEVKTYARSGGAGKWMVVEQPQWKPLTDNVPSRHANAIAKQGGCDGRTASRREDTIRALQRSHKAYD